MNLALDVVAVAMSRQLVSSVPVDVEAWAKKFVSSPQCPLLTHPMVIRYRRESGLDTQRDARILATSRLRWVSNADRWRTVERLKAKLPTGITGVAGVARSGLSTAVEIAMAWHLPVYSLQRGALQPLLGGWRFRDPPQDDGTLLVVDDTVASGQSFEALAPTLAVLRKSRPVITAVVYASPDAKHAVDLYGEELVLPHLLEWNFANSIHSDSVALDFDGVLCEDCPPVDDDDGDRYRSFLRTVAPKYLFRLRPVPLIVTARLEKYRTETMQWLAAHRVRVKKLVMGPWRDIQERAAKWNPGEFKGTAYRNSRCSLFVESCPLQAEAIFRFSGRPVLCPATGQVWQ